MEQPITVRPEPGQSARIKRLAELSRRSQSGVIRYALELGLQELERREGQQQRAETQEV